MNLVAGCMGYKTESLFWRWNGRFGEGRTNTPGIPCKKNIDRQTTIDNSKVGKHITKCSTWFWPWSVTMPHYAPLSHYRSLNWKVYNSFLDLKLFGTIDTGQGSKCFGTTTLSLNMKLRFWCAECVDWNTRCTSRSMLMWFVHSKLATIFSIKKSTWFPSQPSARNQRITWFFVFCQLP